MSTLELIMWWGIVLLGIGGSAICSGLEVGLYTVNRVLVRVHADGEKGTHGANRARVLESQIEHATPTLTALLVWNNVFNYGGTLAITALISTLGLGDVQMILLQIVVLTPVLLVFAESTPKEVFRSHADTLMERFAYMILFLRLSLTWIPIVPVILWIANRASKLVGVDAFGSFTARHRMADLLKFGSTSMSDTQVSLIDRALELEHATVRSEMIPLRNAVVVRSHWSISKARSFVRSHPYSRYPVLSPKGQVVGILRGIDLYINPEIDSVRTVDEIIHKPTRIEGKLSVSQALGALSRSGGRLGIVVVGGRDVGVITRKDLVEPLVGELEDW